ncbi:MAG: GH3 auxin-responsive promoter family protein [Candidatus Thorarchaeota archaeon]
MGLISKVYPKIAKRAAKEIDDILNNPISLTEAKLMSILEQHSHTMFGKDNNFANIRTPEEFSESVPLHDYASMKPYWDHIYANPKQPTITADPVIWYVQSSGTSGKPKALPISMAGMTDFKNSTSLLLPSFVNMKEGNERVLDGTMLNFAAPAKFGEINGVPLGYMTGISNTLLMSRLGKKMIKPGEDVFNITDIGEKLWAYAKYAVKEDITGLAGITTLSIAFIRRMQNEYGPDLLKEFSGTKHEAKIKEALNDDGSVDLDTLWPNLIFFSASGIDSEPYRPWIKDTLPNSELREAYAGSEGGYGISMLPHNDNGIQLLPHINYFEFIPESDIDKEDPTVVPLSEVKKGHRYEMVITNLMGYTRYRVGDMLTFIDTDPYSVYRIGRKGRTVNLSGEKLTDAHVTEGISVATRETGARLIDYSVVGAINDGQAHYTIDAMLQNDVDLLEFGRIFDETVGANNDEFQYVRDFGSLGPTIVRKMVSSHTENIIQNSHIQAKAQPLTEASQMVTSTASDMASVSDGV